MARKWIAVRVDLSELGKAEQLLKEKAPGAIKRASKRALKSGASTFKSARKGGAPKIYKVTTGELQEFIRVKETEMTVKSRLLTMGNKPSHFSITPKAYEPQKGRSLSRRRKAAAMIKKGRKKSFPHAFIVNPAAIKGGTTMLWERTGKKEEGKELISPIRSVSAAQMLQEESVEESVMKAIGETFQKRIDHELERIWK